MNQRVQFPDREWWEPAQQAVCFPALVNGFQVTCAISGAAMAARFGGKEPQQWLDAFRVRRWDLEEEAEALILSQQEDAQGWYWLS